jgi:transcriptional regulator with XRE-family HTH domain
MEDYMEKLRKELSGLLKEKLAGSELRQIDLARELGVTPAAVSQMLSGKITLNIVQLQKLSEKLNCSRSEYSRMQDLLTNIKSRGRLGLSYLNYELQRARKEHNMSLAELSRQTDIPVNDIKLYENSPCLEPERQELSRLCKALGLSISRFIQVEYPTAHAPSPPPSVREEPETYRARRHVPQLELKELKKFRPGVNSIDAFVQRQSARGEAFLGVHLSDKMFAATATADELPVFSGLGATLILLQDYAKDGDVVLAHLGSGGFTLRRYRRKDSRIILEPIYGGMEPLILEEDDVRTADFILPVVEIIFNTGRTS